MFDSVLEGGEVNGVEEQLGPPVLSSKIGIIIGDGCSIADEFLEVTGYGQALDVQMGCHCGGKQRNGLMTCNVFLEVAGIFIGKDVMFSFVG